MDGQAMNGQTWIIELPYDKPPLTGNGIQRMHRLQKGRVTKKLRATTAKLVAKAGVPTLDAVSVQLVWLVPTAHRRDEDNVVPTLKPICDGIVDAGVVADDTPDRMEKGMPIIAHVRKLLRRQPDAGLYLILWELDKPTRDEALEPLRDWFAASEVFAAADEVAP